MNPQPVFAVCGRTALGEGRGVVTSKSFSTEADMELPDKTTEDLKTDVACEQSECQLWPVVSLREISV